jgi:hypothetical protein
MRRNEEAIMSLAEPQLQQLGEEVRQVRDFLVGDLARKVERLARRRPLLLYSLRQPGLRLRNPIAISLEDDGAQVIASAYDLDLFGYGETEGEALDDLRRTIVDLYFTLRENVSSLGALPVRVWEYLTDIVEEEARYEDFRSAARL